MLMPTPLQPTEDHLLVVVQHLVLGHTPIGLPLALQRVHLPDHLHHLEATNIMVVAKVPQAPVIQQPRGPEVKVPLLPPDLRLLRLEEPTVR